MGRRLRLRQLFGYRRRALGAADLEVIAAATEIEDLGIVRVLQYASEPALAETFAVTSKQLASTGTDNGCANRGVVTDQRVDGASQKIERFVARKTLAADADGVLR